MLISAINALTLSPALCAILLKHAGPKRGLMGYVMRGIDGETAARFSFLLALPAVFGAAILSLKDLGQVNGHALLPYVAGTLAALLTGLCCIHLLMGIIRRRRLHWFALYCWLAGGVGLILFF